ncbi:MAG: hypothetical protein BGN95_03900 [Sphingomonas sp. 66-10]|uniref:hypothetical protein n=1 Tax=Sphingomonas sp. 66-10 TaxID=1895848 RepID=UPI00092CE1F0|nr:hypothetical protein [Sphingomonas sp. 66-10]OJU22720.1 MAG: hypothetical protein BGN95_03900 [Sphingomonas sp. 66-10]
MEKFDDKLGPDYESRIAAAMIKLIRKESKRSDGTYAMNVGRAIDGMVMGMSLILARANEADTPFKRNGLAGYIHKKLLQGLEVANDARSDPEFPR